MLWKTTPEAWTKGVWWNMKRLSKNMNWRKHEGKSNPLVPYFMAKILHTTLKEFKASEESPAVLARGKPMNHHQMQNEGGGEETTQKRRRPEGG
jgi:hypothetical protein